MIGRRCANRERARKSPPVKRISRRSSRICARFYCLQNERQFNMHEHTTRVQTIDFVKVAGVDAIRYISNKVLLHQAIAVAFRPKPAVPKFPSLSRSVNSSMDRIQISIKPKTLGVPHSLGLLSQITPAAHTL